jgi:uncharacterized protein involved in exopolysaccharide biosynthesis
MQAQIPTDDEEGLSLRDLIAAARRRWLQAVLIAAALLAVAVPVALLWPPVYRSTATILIEEQEIPRDLVRSTVTSYADERIQVIGQQVMSRGTLMELIDRFNLYARERKYTTNEDLLERMRRDIRVQTVSADITDRRSGMRTAATIAFKLSFDDRDPATAQKVANELVTMYLNENLKTRREKADETSAFLSEEAKRLGERISGLESQIAQFKEKNAGRLPELMQVNEQSRDRTETELTDVDRQIRMLEDRRLYVDSQLALVKDAPPSASEKALDPRERLRLLRNQYTSASGIYSAEHPDVVRLRREIEALEKTVKAPGSRDQQSLDEARAELARLSERYSPDHPDVVKQRKRVEALESVAAEDADKAGKRPDNPVYVSLETQGESIRMEIESLRERRKQLQSTLAEYRMRVEQTPSVEHRYRDLERDRENTVAKYREIRAKQMEAEVATALEKDRKAERFSLIDPPQYPEKPQAPNRPMLLLGALVVSLGGGFGAGAFTEVLDGSVKGARALAALLEAPPLAVVPRIRDVARLRRRRRLFVIAAAAVAVAIVLALAAIHVLLMPLDTLWYAVLRRLEF